MDGQQLANLPVGRLFAIQRARTSIKVEAGHGPFLAYLLFAVLRLSGYIVARMRYELILAPSAAKDLRRLKATIRAAVRDAIEQHLRHEPTKLSKSRIKRLRGLSHPQYRLRIEDVRVFYDVREATVEILAIVLKSEADTWLSEEGKAEAENGETN